MSVGKNDQLNAVLMGFEKIADPHLRLQVINELLKKDTSNTNILPKVLAHTQNNMNNSSPSLTQLPANSSMFANDGHKAPASQASQVVSCP